MNQVSGTPLHPACLPLAELQKDCHFETTRRSGPGGQHRNKVETAVVVTHRPTGVRAEASERRSQGENRRVAYHRLRIQLAMRIRSKPSPDGKARWEPWRRGSRISINPANEGFPCLLADLLDRLDLAEQDLTSVASQLDVTTSQLVKFLKLEPLAFAGLNEARRNAGQHPYK